MLIHLKDQKMISPCFHL